jgi:hypothetical protein
LIDIDVRSCRDAVSREVKGNDEAHARRILWSQQSDERIAGQRLYALPLLYVIALRRESDTIRFPVEGVDGGSVSMLAVRIG